MRAWPTGRHRSDRTWPVRTSDWPVAPWSTRSRSGEPALKNGPSVCSGVRRPRTQRFVSVAVEVPDAAEVPACGVGDGLDPVPPQPPARTTIAAAAVTAPRLTVLGGAVERARRNLAPELLEPVEVARLGREDVHDDVEVVHEDPTGLTEPLDPLRQQAVLLLHPEVDAVVDGLGLALRVARADNEVVRVAERAAEVQLDDVRRFLRLGEP